MEATIFILSWCSYTDSDDYLYSNVETFTDETKANKQFHKACRKAYEECEWGSQWDDPEDERDEGCKYEVNERHCPHHYTVSSSAYDGYKVEVRLWKAEIEVPTE